jgi:hypothetical protein
MRENREARWLRRSAAGSVEGRRLDEGNTGQQNAFPDGEPGRWRVKCAGSCAPSRDQGQDARFTALLHHVDLDRLHAAYRALSPRAAAGVDEVTWHSYGQDGGQPPGFAREVERGAYRAKPSRRVYIPKADGRLRPLGFAALEDEIVQRAVVEVLTLSTRRTSSASRTAFGRCPGSDSIARRLDRGPQLVQEQRGVRHRASRYGMPPDGGFALCLERWVARLAGARNIRETTLFPRDVNRLVPEART